MCEEVKVKEESIIEEKSQPTIELEDENFWRMLEEKSRANYRREK